MFMLVECSLETFGCLVVLYTSVEQFKSTLMSLAGREYALTVTGQTVMQMPSVSNWDSWVEMLPPLFVALRVQEVNLCPGVSMPFPVLPISTVIAIQLVCALPGLEPVIPLIALGGKDCMQL